MDFDRIDQVNRMAKLLSSMPPQQPGGTRIPLHSIKAAQWAVELFDLHGLRVHTDLASVELVADLQGDTAMGVNRPLRVVDRTTDADQLLALLREVAGQGVPGMAELAERIEAADTPEKRLLVIAAIDRENPGLIPTARKHFDPSDPARVAGA